MKKKFLSILLALSCSLLAFSGTVFAGQQSWVSTYFTYAPTNIPYPTQIVPNFRFHSKWDIDDIASVHIKVWLVEMLPGGGYLTRDYPYFNFTSKDLTYSLNPVPLNKRYYLYARAYVYFKDGLLKEGMYTEVVDSGVTYWKAFCPQITSSIIQSPYITRNKPSRHAPYAGTYPPAEPPPSDTRHPRAT